MTNLTPEFQRNTAPALNPNLRAATLPTTAAEAPGLKARVTGLNFYYGDTQALKNVNLSIAEKRVTSLIGPSGCGKTTYLRCFNRMHDLYPNNRYEGEILLYPDEINIIGPKVDPIEVRMRIGMVFQKANPFPKTIYENVAYGLRVRGVRKRSVLDERSNRRCESRRCGTR